MKSRFLSTILALLVAVSIVAMPSYAEETPVSDIEYPEEAISLLSSFGLINPEDYKEAGHTFTRRDLAEKLVSVTNMQNCTFDGQLPFTDVDYYDLSYSAIGTCVKQGLMNGVSENSFAPSAECSVTEVTVTLMRALGYKHIAESKGGYAFGYLAQANSVGLFDKIDSSLLGGMCTNRIFAQMLCNMLEAEVYKISGFENGEPSIDRGGMYMTEIFGIENAEGIVTTNYLTSVDSAKREEKGYICIDGVRYYAGSVPADSYLGCSVNFYFRKNDGKTDELLYIEPSALNRTTVIKSEDIESVNKNKISYYDNGKSKTATIPTDADWIYNNGFENPVDFSVLNMSGDGQIILISNDGDNSADVVKVEEYTNIYVSAVNRNTGDIYDEYSPANNLHINLDRVGDGIYIYDNARETMDFDAIMEGSVLSCLVSRSGDVIMVFDTIKEVVGTISEAEKEGSAYISVVIDGTRYDVASNLASHMDDIDIGKTHIAAYLDINGKLAGYKMLSEDQYTYAYLSGAIADGTFMKTLKVKLYKAGSPRGEFTTLQCGKSIKIDDVDYKTDDASVQNTLNKLKLSENQLVAVKTDTNDNLIGIKTINGGGIQLVAQQNNSYYVADSPSGLLGRMPIPADVEVIYIPDDGNEKNFYTGSKADFVHDKQYALVTGYKTEDERIAPDVVIMSAPTGAAALSGTVDCVVVTDVRRSVIDESGTEGTKIVGFCDGVSREMFIEDDVEVLSLKNDVLTLREGDVMRAAVDSLGNISAVQVLYRAGEDLMYADQNPSGDWNSSPRIYKAWVYKQHDAQVMFSFMHPDSDGYDGNTEIRNISTRTEIYVYDSSKPDGSKISLGSAKDLLAYYDLSGSCSEVFCHTRGSLLELAMVIK